MVFPHWPVQAMIHVGFRRLTSLLSHSLVLDQLTAKLRRTKMSVVYFDLETTNRFTTSQIVGLGAIDDQGNEFHRHIIPTCAINFMASKIHGITKVGDGLFFKGEEIEDAMDDPGKALEEFMAWLEERNCKYLVAHNNYKFDRHVLRHNLSQFGVEESKNLHYKDSMEFVKEFKDLKSKALKNCLQYFCGQAQKEPHDALDDAKACKNICEIGAKKLGHENFKEYLEQEKDFLL